MLAWPRSLIALHRFAAVVVTLGVGGAAYATADQPGWAALGLVGGAAYYRLATRRYRRRRILLAAPIDPSHQKVLRERVRFYRALDPAGRQRFEDDVRIFLAEQQIHGLQGRSVSEDVRLLIGASAAILTFGLPHWEWPRMRDIVVYPRAFTEDYETDADDAHVAGMVHMQGPILFSREDLKLGFNRGTDGHNVGLHEMAHVMDMVDGAADGVPADLPWISSAPWVNIVANRLRKVRAGRSVLRPYAGTNEAELFAVAVEAFYERPHELNKHDPDLFEALSTYFNVDPRHPRLS